MGEERDIEGEIKIFSDSLEGRNFERAFPGIYATYLSLLFFCYSLSFVPSWVLFSNLRVDNTWLLLLIFMPPLDSL